MVKWFINFLESIFSCHDEPSDDFYQDHYGDHDNHRITIRDQRTTSENFFIRRDHSSTLSGSDSTARIPLTNALVSPSTNPYQVVTPSSSASGASTISSDPKPKPFQPPQPCVIIHYPPASSKPPCESAPKPSYTPSQASSKPPLFASSSTSSSSSASAASSVSSNAQPKLFELRQPRVIIQPPASSKPPYESSPKPSYTPSPASSKPSLFASSSTSASSSAPAASSVSSDAQPKPFQLCLPPVIIQPPPASSKPPNESASKPSYSPPPASSKPPLFASSSTSASSSGSAASSISSSQATRKLFQPSKPYVNVLPPAASSIPPDEPVSEQSYTHSPSVFSREQAPSPKPQPVASLGASSSSKHPPVVSSKSKSPPVPSSSSLEFHEGDLKPVKAVLRCVYSEGDNTTYAQEDTSPIYMIPKEIQDIIKRDKVPEILRSPMSPSTYKDYFATLLYAEDFHIKVIFWNQKWSKFELKDVSLQLHEASVLKQSKDRKRDAKDAKENRNFVAFEIDSVPERRPFFLSRDFVFAKPVGEQDRKFQGIIHRVQRSRQVLVEFEEGFYAQHNSRSRYDLGFSFNRVCLKRAHQALEAALHPSFKNFLFPVYSHRSDYSPRSPSSHSLDMLDLDQQSAIRHILGLRGSPPYLVADHTMQYPKLSYSKLSRTEVLVREAVLGIYRTVKNCRILVSAPKNRKCDDLMSSLMKDIPESEMFRANAAFRDIVEVPEDIISSCQYKNDCFTVPPLQKLKKFRVVFSTFVSGFRLHHHGMKVGHFSHIFLVDASLAIEPEVMITLANFANDDTSVIVIGSPFTNSRWVRSDIAWRNGLQKSYFQRLRENALYKTLDPAFITQLQDPERRSH